MSEPAPAGDALPPGWRRAISPSALLADLARELPPGHELAGLPLTVFAQRHGRDDASFAVADGTARFAEVHLTHRYETKLPWPMSTIYKSFGAWVEAVHADPDDA